MNRYINNIHINQVRHLKDIDIPLEKEAYPHLMITGKNGSGKTSLLNAIADHLEKIVNINIYRNYKESKENLELLEKEFSEDIVKHFDQVINADLYENKDDFKKNLNSLEKEDFKSNPLQIIQYNRRQHINLFNEVYDKFKMKFYKNIFKRFEDRSPTLTVLELFCVEIIYALKRPTISQLTEFMETSQPNTAYRVASLVKKGYVKKVQSTDDKREFYLEVTDKYYGYSDIKEQYINIVIDRLRKQSSREEIEHFERLLRLMTNELMSEITDEMKKSTKLI